HYPTLTHRCLSFIMATPPPTHYTLSLHDALPIWCNNRGLTPPARQEGAGPQHRRDGRGGAARGRGDHVRQARGHLHDRGAREQVDRKSTRLNSSHLGISYAVFCLKKKKTVNHRQQ